MTNPKAREALEALRASWSDLKPQQRGEQLKVLIGFGCTGGGIATDLGQPGTTIRNYIKLATDWVADMEDAWADPTQEQSTMIAGEVACHFPSKIPAEKRVETVIKEVSPAQDHVPTSPTQETKKIATPLSTDVKEAPLVNGAMSRQANQTGGRAQKTSLLDEYRIKEPVLDPGLQRVAAIPDQINPRRNFDATSMKRQGKPVPPEDPNKPVS